MDDFLEKKPKKHSDAALATAARRFPGLLLSREYKHLTRAIHKCTVQAWTVHLWPDSSETVQAGQHSHCILLRNFSILFRYKCNQQCKPIPGSINQLSMINATDDVHDATRARINSICLRIFLRAGRNIFSNFSILMSMNNKTISARKLPKLLN